MTPAPREWVLGKSFYRLEQPDLLWVKQRDGSLEVVTRAVELYRQLGTVCPFFVLADMDEAEVLAEDAKHHINEHVRPEWVLGYIYINTRLIHRATAMGLLRAYEMTQLEPHPWRGRIHFVSTSAEGRALYARLHERQGLMEPSATSGETPRGVG